MNQGSGGGMGGGAFPWMAAGGLLGSALSYKNPADAAQPYYDRIPSETQRYYRPYIDAGKQALGTLQGQYTGLLNDPGQKLSQIGSGYSESPGYQWNVEQATNAANNAASAGGMRGSPQHQQQISSMVSGLANQDYYNYLNQALGLYGQGLQGTQGINTMGYNASNSYADLLANSLMAQGNLAYTGQQNENQQGANWGAGLGLIGQGVSSALSFL